MDHDGHGARRGGVGAVVRLGPDARLSLVVSTLQEGRIDQPVSSGALHLRREHAGGQFLQELRQLEHLADAEPALCLLLVEGPQPGGRVPLPHRTLEDAQSESPAILFLTREQSAAWAKFTTDSVDAHWVPGSLQLGGHPVRREALVSENVYSRVSVMSWYEIAVNWKQLKSSVQEKWAKLTDDDLTTIAGRRDRFARVLQDKCGYAKERAERELDDFAHGLIPVAGIRQFDATSVGDPRRSSLGASRPIASRLQPCWMLLAEFDHPSRKRP